MYDISKKKRRNGRYSSGKVLMLKQMLKKIQSGKLKLDNITPKVTIK